MNNSSTSTDCPAKADWVTKSIDSSNYFTYDIFVYPYFLLGLSGHGYFLRLCYQKSKSEPAFLLQGFLSTIRIFEIISFTLLVFGTIHCSGLVEQPGVIWYQQCLPCMWFTAHISVPMVNGFINTSLLLTLCISIDRLIAISKPHIYRQPRWQRKRNKVGMLILCLFIGFAIVVADTVRFILLYTPADGLYVMKDNLDYLNTTTAMAFLSIRIFVLVCGVTALWICNIWIIWIHNYKMLQIITSSNITTLVKSTAEILKEAKRKEAERALLLLILCQGIINALAIGSLASWYMSFYLAPAWLHCSSILMLWAPLVDFGLQMAVIYDFYVPLIISKPVQRMVLPCLTKVKTSSVRAN